MAISFLTRFFRNGNKKSPSQAPHFRLNAEPLPERVLLSATLGGDALCGLLTDQESERDTPLTYENPAHLLPGEDHGHDHDHAGGLHSLPGVFTDSDVPDEPLGAKHPLSSIPELHSNPGAPVTIYLDFDGHFEATWGAYSNVTTPVYDTDGDPTTFSDAELAAIREVWERVAEDYAPFNVNVTTVNPGSFANRQALRVSIGGNGSWYGALSGGVAYVNTFTNSIVNTVYVFSNNLGGGTARYVADASSHEAGHAFGLLHQSTYNASGNRTQEYNTGTAAVAPLLGNSYSAQRSVWYYGTSSSGASSMQDDLAIISSPTNGFGYREDDHGNTAATASALTVNGTSVAGSGIISENDDVDYFSFTTAAGQVSFTVNVASVGPNLDAVLELRDANDNLITTANPSNSLNATITATVAAGEYRLVVRNTGEYGALGQYTVTGTIQASTAPVAPANVTATALSSTQIRLTWSDTANETGYRIYTWNGSQSVYVTDVPANTTSYTISGLAPGTRYNYLVGAYNPSGVTYAAWVATTTQAAAPVAPVNVTATAISPTQIQLTWNDVSNETFYRIYTWNGSQSVYVTDIPANTTSFVVSGLTPGRTYNYLLGAGNSAGVTFGSWVATTTPLAAPELALEMAGNETSIAWT